AELGLLASGFQDQVLLAAGRVDQPGQHQTQRLVEDDRGQADDQHGGEAEVNGDLRGLPIIINGPKDALEDAAAVHREADQDDVDEEEYPVDPKSAGQQHFTEIGD